VGVAPALGDVLCSLGRHEEAEPLVRLSEEHTTPDDLLAQLLWRTVLGRVLAARGEHAAAEAVSREAAAIAAQTECLNVHGGVRMSLAEVLGQAGRASEAAAAAAEARALFERKGNVVDAARAAVWEPARGAAPS